MPRKCMYPMLITSCNAHPCSKALTNGKVRRLPCRAPSGCILYPLFFFAGKILLLKSNTGRGHGICTVSQTSRIARYLRATCKQSFISEEHEHQGDLPATNEPNESKATSDLQELQDVSEIGFGSCRRNGGIGGGDEREQHHEAKEEEDEEQVDA